MHIDEFLELARSRRSIRRFKPDPIPDEYVEKILEAARWAPSGANGQPWEFIVVKDQEIKKKLAEAYGRCTEMVVTIDRTRTQEYMHPGYRVRSPADTVEVVARERFTVWSVAPVVIAVLGDQRVMQASTLAARMFEHHTFDQNMANAAYAIHLAAAALGLGAQWISILPPAAEEMKLILGIPSMLTLFNLNPIGYPAVKPTPYRRELSEMVHFDKYDMSKFRSNEDVQEYLKFHRKRYVDTKALPY